MSIESVVALGFIGLAVISMLCNAAYTVGLFDAIAVKLTNYIVARMEYIEKGDI
jgi:hypothetical protein